MMRAISNGQAILIDVREDAEWQSGHLQDAKHLALSELMRGVAAPRLNQLMPSGKIVYLHCASGGRCLKAADLLKTAGSETRPLKYGYESLLQLGMAKAK
ncbi:MAG: rhodanese-like domain-containing protein [Gemmataceae bacterium]